MKRDINGATTVIKESGTNPTVNGRNGIDDARVYLVGGGIASLAAAVFLIRDGNVRGQNITILESMEKSGGSLDADGSPQSGYRLRGGRMIESKYLCTYDLFSSIPTLDGSRTVTQEIFAWNETIKTMSKSRMVRNGHRETAPTFGLSERHILVIERLSIEPEGLLGRSSIREQFDAAFFRTNFWLMWCTTFAFQPWHSAVEFKRYLVRFAHMVGGFSQLKGIMRTVFNQYDSMVRPLEKWLEQRGVVFAFGTRVTDVGMVLDEGRPVAKSLICQSRGQTTEITVGQGDYVIVTLGSMTDASSFGSMDSAAVPLGKEDGTAWTLWETIAGKSPGFGQPWVFSNHVDESKWTSFTTTLHDGELLRVIRDLTGNVPGEGGLITFPDSAWLMSIVIPYQPHFPDQPADVSVFWGYGLSVDAPGNFVNKPMVACTGRELMTELMGHLHVGSDAARLVESSICIPCLMPFITSQFLRRQAGDRPEVVPDGARNLAFIGQFCELPDDVVFTVEYSVRSARKAVCELLDLKDGPPDVYKGALDLRVLGDALIALHRAEA